MPFLAPVAIAASAIGAGVSAYSAYRQGQAQKAMGEYNAQIAMGAADNEAKAATENANRQRETNQRRLATIRAQMAGSGVNIGQGSALDVLGESAQELELATLDAFRESTIRQQQYQSQAAMSLWEGNQAAKAGTIGAVGTLLSGLGNAASQGAGGYQSGIFKVGN